MVVIAQSILPKAKRYISDAQKTSINLFVANKLFENEKPEIVDLFLEDYHHKLKKPKYNEYYNQFFIIDKAGLFFPVFIQEMLFLGKKVFNKPKHQIIMKEVNDLILFLKKYSERKIGDKNIPTEFFGYYCRFSMMIVGKEFKIDQEGEKPYLIYLEKISKNLPYSIYLIGDIKNKNFLNKVSSIVQQKNIYELLTTKEYKAKIRAPEGKKRIPVISYLVVLVKKEKKTYYSSEDQESLEK